MAVTGKGSETSVRELLENVEFLALNANMSAIDIVDEEVVLGKLMVSIAVASALETGFLPMVLEK